VGTGQMAAEYAHVFSALGVRFDAVGRSAAGAEAFRDRTGVLAHSGGLESYLKGRRAPLAAVVAVDVPNLASVTLALLDAGARSVLVEKPGGLTFEGIQSLCTAASRTRSKIFVGYNRRFYTSTSVARRLIESDGGLVSMDFEFTEWTDSLAEAPISEIEKQRWVIANSSHVIDLAFHLAGAPQDWQSWRTGNFPWHLAGARFVGAGLTVMGVPFAYSAAWDAPGRWGLTLRTTQRRMRLQPMEQLLESFDGIQDQPRVLDDGLDREHKPGLYRQVEAFLMGDDSYLCQIDEHLGMMQVYAKIAGYEDGAES